MKHCNGCDTTKELSEFGKDRHTPDGLCWKCKDCRNAYLREYNKKNPEIIKKIRENNKKWRQEYYKRPEIQRKNRNAQLKKDYGISLEEYENILESQGGVCAICSGDEISNRNRFLCIDHCHDSNKIRGILCNRCNRAIGLFKDNPEILMKATKYLEKGIKNAKQFTS